MQLCKMKQLLLFVLHCVVCCEGTLSYIINYYKVAFCPSTKKVKANYPVLEKYFSFYQVERKNECRLYETFS
jgi:hypothetical protein